MLCRPTTQAPPPPPPLKELRSPEPNWVLIQEGASAEGSRARADARRHIVGIGELLPLKGGLLGEDMVE